MTLKLSFSRCLSTLRSMVGAGPNFLASISFRTVPEGRVNNEKGWLPRVRSLMVGAGSVPVNRDGVAFEYPWVQVQSVSDSKTDLPSVVPT